MNWQSFTMSDRFARYFVSLVVGNNIFGLFVTLSMFRADGLPFFALLLIVLSIAHATGLVCLAAIDFVLWLYRLVRKSAGEPSALMMIATVGVVLVPALYVGFLAGALVAQALGMDWYLSFANVVRPGVLFGIMVTSLALMSMKWLKNMQAHYEQKAALMAAERRLLQARFDLFAKELHPHLLFNVIQNVLSLINKDADLAKRMLEELAVYYQEVLLVIDKAAISFGEEIRLSRHFMALQQSRYKRLSFRIDNRAEGRIEHILVPPLLVQPILENAVKFAIDDDGKDRLIEMIITERNHALHIEVINPVSKAAQRNATGFSKGLSNCEHRIRDFFGQGAQITIAHSEHKTIVELVVPYAP